MIADVVRKRRTTKNFDGKPVAKETISTLLDLTRWAPNHRLTEPWKFRVLTASGIRNWLAHMQSALSQEERVNFETNFKRITQAGAIVYTTSARDTNAAIDLENYAAVCAGVQNLLLGATALGLQTYWGTGKIFSHPETLHFLQVGETERFVGAIWLGHGEIPAIIPARKPIEEKTKWIE